MVIYWAAVSRPKVVYFFFRKVVTFVNYVKTFPLRRAPKAMVVIAPRPKEMKIIGRRAAGNLFFGRACCTKKYLNAPFFFNKKI